MNDPSDLAPLRWPLLEGRRVIITGGAGGIGRATAALFATMGARLALIDIGSNTQDAARDLGPRHLGIVADVADPAACAAAIAEAARGLNGLDALVTMAGTVHPGGMADITDAGWRDTIDMHLTGTFNACRAAIPRLRESRGTIVCMSSIAGERGGGLRGGTHYAAAKAGVLGLVRAMARELAPEGVRVNAVCPGAIHTDKRSFADMNAMLGTQIPMGRVGTSDEVARVFLFLASDLSTYMTGATIDVNGGLHIH